MSYHPYRRSGSYDPDRPMRKTPTLAALEGELNRLERRLFMHERLIRNNPNRPAVPTFPEKRAKLIEQQALLVHKVAKGKAAEQKAAAEAQARAAAAAAADVQEEEDSEEEIVLAAFI
ncbi:hypothetical protein B0H19DRAFT_1248625 [Mycena capillaripes]|nr:hypothetical protein B0H19DRAFT_1248625 [Mycena capillaripes]